METLLEVKDVNMRFGGLLALDNFNLKITSNKLFGLIGPNGAGKSTAFNVLTGIYMPTSGSIIMEGKDVTGGKPHEITKKRMARTFQNIRLFKDLSVLDNIKVGFDNEKRYSFLDSILRTKRFRISESEIEDRSFELLKVFNLQDKAYFKADNLSYGNQRKLEILRALATNPKILLLDEPAAGMNPQETDELTDIIKFIQNEFSVAILLIEHDMKLVMRICDEITVLDYGKIIAQGSPQLIKSNSKVIEAYLGGVSQGVTG